MTKRTKKAPVKPEMRRQWLRRHEEDGESPPQIAETDGYDVRTVRKQIEIGRQERERREARSIVLRRALEQHYADLCAFAQKLDYQVSQETGTLIMLRDERMWSALREHLPRSPIWKSLGRWEQLREEEDQIVSEMEQPFAGMVRTRSASKYGSAPWQESFVKGTTAALTFHCRLVAKGEQGLLSGVEFNLTPTGGDSIATRLGAFHIGVVPKQHVSGVQELVTELLSEVVNSSEYDRLQRVALELKRVRRVLSDELAVIILRRVVPGRCKYCPL